MASPPLPDTLRDRLNTPPPRVKVRLLGTKSKVRTDKLWELKEWESFDLSTINEEYQSVLDSALHEFQLGQPPELSSQQLSVRDERGYEAIIHGYVAHILNSALKGAPNDSPDFESHGSLIWMVGSNLDKSFEEDQPDLGTWFRSRLDHNGLPETILPGEIKYEMAELEIRSGRVWGESGMGGPDDKYEEPDDGPLEEADARTENSVLHKLRQPVGYALRLKRKYCFLDYTSRACCYEDPKRRFKCN